MKCDHNVFVVMLPSKLHTTEKILSSQVWIVISYDNWHLNLLAKWECKGHLFLLRRSTFMAWPIYNKHLQYQYLCGVLCEVATGAGGSLVVKLTVDSQSQRDLSHLKYKTVAILTDLCAWFKKKEKKRRKMQGKNYNSDNHNDYCLLEISWMQRSSCNLYINTMHSVSYKTIISCMVAAKSNEHQYSHDLKYAIALPGVAVMSLSLELIPFHM